MARGRPKQSETKANKNGNGANGGFEAELFLAADKLRNDATYFERLQGEAMIDVSPEEVAERLRPLF